MLGRHFATILARTDPFDLAQALERHIRSLSGEQIRALIEDTAPRMNDGYRSEFVPLADEPSDDRLRAAFTRSLKSNLRAVPLFGPQFSEGVIAGIPGDRTIGLGEERSRARQLRPAAFAVIALALLLGGAAAEHVLSNARTNANVPVVLLTPEPDAAPAAPRARKAAAPKHAAPRRATPVPVPAVAVAPQSVPARPAPVVKRPPAPPGGGVRTIVARAPQPTPAPHPTPVDVTDMPQSYSDATPLPPDATPPPAQVNTAVRVSTPTPPPNRYWLHQTLNGVGRTIQRLNPFKHRKAPAPSASPYGAPQP